MLNDTSFPDEGADGAPPPLSSATVLVVDDDDSVRRMVVRQVSSLGYKVLEANGGRSAEKMLADELQIDLLLTDLAMPDLDGVELAEVARQSLPDLKVVYMSGYPEEFSVKELNLRASAILLRKPFRKADLAHYIREILT